MQINHVDVTSPPPPNAHQQKRPTHFYHGPFCDPIKFAETLNLACRPIKALSSVSSRQLRAQKLLDKLSWKTFRREV